MGSLKTKTIGGSLATAVLNLPISSTTLWQSLKRTAGFAVGWLQPFCRRVRLSRNSRPLSKGDAGKRLTQTFELLEQILLQLPLPDILFAQGVDRTFQSTILNSSRLQRELFLQPLPRKPNIPVRLNPLLERAQALKRLPVFFDRSEQRLAIRAGPARDRLLAGNPVLRKGKGKKKKDEYVRWELERICYVYHAHKLEKLQPLYDGGSWKNMYLTQPPCKVACRIDLRRVAEPGSAAMVNGVYTIDELLDALCRVKVTRDSA